MVEKAPQKEIKRRMNKWVFADLSINISSQIWQIGQAYKNRYRDSKEKPHHLNKYPVQLTKYFYFLYLTGSRLMEPIIEPPQLSIINREGKVWVEIQKVNEKHKALDGSGREIIDQALPVFNEWERMMWNFITDGGAETNTKDIFQFEKWKSIHKNNLNCLIKTNFKTTLRDEKGKPHQNYGITPHILRHMRAFSVVVNYGVDIPLAIKWFGWTDQRMLFYYAHIRKELNIGNQVEMLKRGDFLTSLTIDMAKATGSY